MTTLLRQGLRRYVPEDRLRRLQELRLGIAGLGGIGSNVAFMLARTGFSRFVLVDEDTVEPSNLNRQFYFPADVGQSKVAALTRHLHELDPGLQIEGLVERVADSTLPRLLPKADFWIEALDGADMKQRLVQACLLATKPVVACSGMGGFGGSMKNIAIGCADGRIGKQQVHAVSDVNLPWDQWPAKEMLMETMSESAKAVIDHFGKHIVYINVLRRMSVDCDCAGTSAAEPTIPDIGILASTDLLAIDQASCDLVYNAKSNKDLVERIESRRGLHQLEYMRELKMGSDRYALIEI